MLLHKWVAAFLFPQFRLLSRELQTNDNDNSRPSPLQWDILDLRMEAVSITTQLNSLYLRALWHFCPFCSGRRHMSLPTNMRTIRANQITIAFNMADNDCALNMSHIKSHRHRKLHLLSRCHISAHYWWRYRCRTMRNHSWPIRHPDCAVSGTF